MRLREKGAPRTSARLKAILEPTAITSACERCQILAASPVPVGWGSEALPDGLNASSRWPRGGALLLGTLGTLAVPDTFPPVANEPNPISLRRGSVAWASSGATAGDGPKFVIALADQPHLGVSLSVWGDVTVEDLDALDAFAAQHASGGMLPLPFQVAPVQTR